MKTLLLVVENRDFILTQYAKFLVMLMAKKWVQGIKFYDGQRRSVWWTRKFMIEEVLKDPTYNDLTHFLFIDTDVIPRLEDGNFVEKLASHDKAGVSGYYCNVDGLPMNRRDGVKFLAPSGLYDMEILGMGYSLWKREVFEKVPYPQPNPICKLDADAEFCKNVIDAGYKIYTDFSLKGFHLLNTLI